MAFAHVSATLKTNSLPKIFTKGFPLYLDDPNLAGIIITVLFLFRLKPSPPNSLIYEEAPTSSIK